MPTPRRSLDSGAYKVREPALVVIFSIITLGIYYLYWTYQVFRELKEHTGQGIGPIIGLVLGISHRDRELGVLRAAVEIGNMYAAAGREKPVSGVTGFWNLIPLVGWIIWVVKVQNPWNLRVSGERRGRSECRFAGSHTPGRVLDRLAG